ncbi:hypothetical protein ASD50_01185 [Mesorhizobium sp. Root552]|uniref:hypothetical protein n=1 Tax=Mesorhizobium sp. Root552 TaxID=1736555 RepID=UPI0006F39607|nr:hypothetical protein [Mesorhizobium sp. Root552]KQZ33426.1 hypothetical protein ASD50_01185 [Mesorhizobium sp. Root552]
MKIILPFLAFLVGLIVPSQAAEKFPFRAIEISYSLQIDDFSWAPLANNYQLFRHNFPSNGLFISRMRVDGQEMLVAQYGGGFIPGCDVDGRFSMFSPMFRLNGKHSDVMRCSNPAKPGEKGTIKYSTTSSFSGGVLTLKSQATEIRRFPGSGGDGTLGHDATDRIELQVALNGGACKVIKGTYRGERKNFGMKGYAKAFSKVPKPSCKVH